MADLQAGAIIGPYRIEGLAGEGGMGAVYRATDTRLHRAVAIKLISSTLSSDPDSHTRFEREARLLAALNHPNVAAIHGIETFDEVRAIVLEFVEGRTLAERLSAGRLPVSEALGIARQIALALAAAHGKGIVHRDLKPSNIKITTAGEVKVLDFGIAKLSHTQETEPAAAAQTRTAPPTRIGAIVGTAAYMSPEQARGDDVDKRTDIWAFGCVLYEMLTGQRPFEGATWSDTIAKVLEREPDWEALRADVPEPVRSLVRRCLQKNPGDRRQDVADVPFELAEVLSRPLRPVPPVKSARRPWWPVAIAGVAAAAAVAVWAWSLLGPGRADREATPAAVEFGVTFPDGHIASAGVAVSPDGRYIAAGIFSNESYLALHSLDSSETTPLPETQGAGRPFWSPDSQTLAFCGAGGLRKMTLPNPMSTIVSASCGDGTWNTRDVIVFAADGKLFEVSALGDTPTAIPMPARRYAVAPQFLSDDRHLIYTDSSRGVGPVVVTSLDGQEVRELVATNAPAVFAPPDHLLFVRGTALMAQRLDQQRLELEGKPAIVASDVLLGLQQGRRANVSASATGVLAYGTPNGGTKGQLTWFNRLGQRGTSIQVSDGSEFLTPVLSPSGRFLAASRMDPQTGDWDIWKIDFEQGVTSRLTTGNEQDTDPIWSPDEKEIVFASYRSGRLGMYRKAVDGSRPEQLLITMDGPTNLVPTDWSRDGRYIIYHQSRPERSSILALPLFGDRKPITLVGREFGPYGARLSPDGKWIAYTSFESGPSEVHVQRFLEPGQKQQVSSGGGTHPRWTNDGRELVYWTVPGGIDAVDFESDGTRFRIGARRPLVQAPVLTLIDGRTKYDVTRDGQRLLVRQPAGPQGPGIDVVLNWTERLKR